jgi:anti-sigma regulatory factor (Ser/Thr protein kinase)
MGPAFVHEALFYRDADEYEAGTVPFIRAALDAGEPVLVAVPGPRIDIIDTALGIDAIHVRFVDMTTAGRNPGKIIPWVLHAFLEEHAGKLVRIIGEPIWAGRTADEYPACVQHEALINVAFEGRDAAILCPYDAYALPADMLADATYTHPVLVDVNVRRDSPSYLHPDDIVAAYNRPLPEPGPDALTMAFNASTLGLLRRFVAVPAVRAGLSPRRVADLQLAVNELATNAIIHGGGHGEVRLWSVERRFVCEVRSRGRARGRLAGRVPPAVDGTSGRGLALVNYVSDLVRIHTTATGTAVRLYLDI